MYLVCFTHIFITIVNCSIKEDVKNKNQLPYFRREFNEAFGDHNVKGSQSNLVSLFVNNIKEIYNDVNNDTEILRPSIATTTDILKNINPAIRIVIKDTEEDPKFTDNLVDYTNHSLTSHKLLNSDSPAHELQMNEKRVIMLLSKQMKSLEKFEHSIGDKNFSLSPLLQENKLPDQSLYRRSCILCNNVMNEECNDPRNKLVQSVLCERDSDVCYSQHTPFGIVDRGCFNVNHNLTTYVCSCNLCNYVSISEMPYIFSNKRDWVDNVVELSRMRNFRKSVFKDMACLQCEVNTTKQKGDMLDSANCLEGNVGSIPTQICKENEICAVKAIRKQGYIWRGCVRTPLYNYWWALCDSDLCNYNSLVYIYDFI